MGCEWMVTVQAEVGDFRAIYQAANELSKRAQKEHEEDPCHEVLSFFQAILGERALFRGNKGDVFLWGGVWNYFQPDDFTDWLARLVSMTPEAWNTNVHLSWEQEQSKERKLRVVWPEQFRGNAVLVADIPQGLRWHWGVCSYSGMPARAIARVDGVPWTPNHMGSCLACRSYIGRFQWLVHDGLRICPRCDDRKPFVEVRTWEEPGGG